ncbi:MAG: hypothetical protein LBH98_08975 [Chitinispirillales bacterium]|nr:hypothetical protein [Chitinispirillales bacterium]
MPFEGQLAFIENRDIKYIILRNKINGILQTHDSIVTYSFLDQIDLNDEFDGAYLSEHQRKNSKQNFTIYHLFFDYSNIVY